MTLQQYAEVGLENAFQAWLNVHGIKPMADYLFRMRNLLDAIKKENESHEEVRK